MTDSTPATATRSAPIMSDDPCATAAGDPLRRSLDAIIGPPVDEETGAPITAAERTP